jgi:hypothetical protein
VPEIPESCEREHLSPPDPPYACEYCETGTACAEWKGRDVCEDCFDKLIQGQDLQDQGMR